LAAEIVKLLFK